MRSYKVEIILDTWHEFPNCCQLFVQTLLFCCHWFFVSDLIASIILLFDSCSNLKTVLYDLGTFYVFESVQDERFGFLIQYLEAWLVGNALSLYTYQPRNIG